MSRRLPVGFVGDFHSQVRAPCRAHDIKKCRDSHRGILVHFSSPNQGKVQVDQGTLGSLPTMPHSLIPYAKYLAQDGSGSVAPAIAAIARILPVTFVVTADEAFTKSLC